MSVDSDKVLTAPQHEAARDHLRDACGRPQHIAPLPRVCAQLAQLTAQEVPDAGRLARLIQSDPALAGELMRVANSPALRPRAAVVSLQQAVSWLGVAEVRNIAMAVMLRGEVFVAPGHEAESEALWQEAWLAGLWAKEIARERRKHVESAYLAALMHRTGAALTLKILADFERERRAAVASPEVTALVTEFEPCYGRLLMSSWCLPDDVQDGASDWRGYRDSVHSDLAGTVHAAHLLALHTLAAPGAPEEPLLEDPVFEHLSVFPDQRRSMIAKRDHVRSLAGL